jgi:hypothetical protein
LVVGCCRSSSLLSVEICGSSFRFSTKKMMVQLEIQNDLKRSIQKSSTTLLYVVKSLPHSTRRDDFGVTVSTAATTMAAQPKCHCHYYSLCCVLLL